MTGHFDVSGIYAFKVVALMAFTRVIAVSFFKTSHPFPRFGPANMVTSLRAGLVALVAGLIGEPVTTAAAMFAAGTSLIVTALDGVDGWLARRTGLASAFGARFDMEVDAFLILTLSILAWQYDKAGAWIILAGILRYLFVIAGWVWPRMQRALLPSWRRQAVCVVQIAGLSVVILPLLMRPASVWLAAALLIALGYSFLVDVVWLWRVE